MKGPKRNAGFEVWPRQCWVPSSRPHQSFSWFIAQRTRNHFSFHWESSSETQVLTYLLTHWRYRTRGGCALTGVEASDKSRGSKMVSPNASLYNTGLGKLQLHPEGTWSFYVKSFYFYEGKIVWTVGYLLLYSSPMQFEFFKSQMEACSCSKRENQTSDHQLLWIPIPYKRHKRSKRKHVETRSSKWDIRNFRDIDFSKCFSNEPLMNAQ